MSRSALWRQEGNVKERERQAEELFRLAVEEGRNNRAKNLLPLWGPDDSFHFNPMLLQNIIKSPYFQKCCRDITDWNTLVDQIYYDVKHVEPWAQDAFCLLLRLLTLRCTEKQMTLLLNHTDSPYIRAIGFLYLRYAGDPATVYKWIEPYLYDDEPISPRASSSKQQGSSETMGEYVRHLFTDKNYYGTILPRLPIQIERDIQVKLLQAEKIEERAKKHLADSRTMDYFQKVGAKVMALYGDEENPIQWYEAMVDRVITTNPETKELLRHPKFVVTFPEYGNTETVLLGEMEKMGATLEKVSTGFGRGDHNDVGYVRGGSIDRGGDGHGSVGYGGRQKVGSDEGNIRGASNARDHVYKDRRRDFDRGGRDDTRKRDGPGYSVAAARPFSNEADLYEEVRRRERDTVTSSSRHAISRRPPSTKTSLSVGSRGDPRGRDYFSQLSPARLPREDRSSAPQSNLTSNDPPPKKRTPEELAAIQAKKQKLMAKYG